MKNYTKKALLFIFIGSSFCLLILDSSRCIRYASQGLLIWFDKMIPTLFPFMVLSGFMVRSKLSTKLTFLFYPLCKLFRISSPMAYGIIMGFFCGFPMGAKVICDLMETNQITKKQGEYLLAFNNNIGPAYLLGYVYLLFPDPHNILYLLLFYAIPFCYGFFLRFHPSYGQMKISRTEAFFQPEAEPAPSMQSCCYYSIVGALQQINLLGGCMILFNCLQIYPDYFLQILRRFFSSLKLTPFLPGILSSLIEIGGGLIQFNQSIKGNPSFFFRPLLFSLLTLGGLSCICQTWFILEKTKLSIKAYFIHKINQSILIFLILCQVTKMLQ